MAVGSELRSRQNGCVCLGQQRCMVHGLTATGGGCLDMGWTLSQCQAAEGNSTFGSQHGDVGAGTQENWLSPFPGSRDSAPAICDGQEAISASQIPHRIFKTTGLKIAGSHQALCYLEEGPGTGVGVWKPAVVTVMAQSTAS